MLPYAGLRAGSAPEPDAGRAAARFRAVRPGAGFAGPGGAGDFRQSQELASNDHRRSDAESAGSRPQATPAARSAEPSSARSSEPSSARSSESSSARSSEPSSALRKKLAALGIRRDSDAVLHLPFRYEDETRLTPIARAGTAGPVLIEGTITRAEVKYRPRPQLLVELADASGTAWLRFFTFYPSQKEALRPGCRVRAFGELRGGLFGAEMAHPRFHVLRGEEPLPDALTPVYPTLAGLSQGALRKFILQALDRADLSDTLPAPWLPRLGLCDFGAAVRTLHRPPPQAGAAGLEDRSHAAWRRIKFDELLAQQLSMRTHYRARLSRRAPSLAAPPALSGRLMRALPFVLTAARDSACASTAAGRAARRT